MSVLRHALLACLALGCVEAQAQPRPPRRDAGVVRRVPRARDAGVDVGPLPPTHGRVEPAQVQSVLTAEREALRRCYDAVLHRDPLAQGEVEVRLRVEDDGRVSQSTVRAEGAALRLVGECIRRRLAARSFAPPTGGAATVVVPFRFAPEG